MTVPATALAGVRRTVALAGLTAWADAFLAGGAPPDGLTDAAHQAGVGQLWLGSDRDPVLLALAALRRQGYNTARLILPAPADAAGLPGPRSFNTEAIAAGAALLITESRTRTPDRAIAILPEEGPRWQGTEVPLPATAVAEWPTWRQARSEFLLAVAGHAEALDKLDVAGDTRGLRDVVDSEDMAPLPRLPDALDGPRQELLARARLVAFLTTTASYDTGAALSAADTTSRAAHLRALARAARVAIAASVSGP